LREVSEVEALLGCRAETDIYLLQASPRTFAAKRRFRRTASEVEALLGEQRASPGALGESVQRANNFRSAPGSITGLVGELDDDLGLDKGSKYR
jgi:hypothetical protein